MVKAAKRIGLVILTIVLLPGAWGLVEPYLLDVETQAAPLPHLPAEWEGATVAVLADFQVGMWLDNLSTAEKAVRRAIEARPAAILLLGDFVYHAVDPEDDAVEKVASLLAPLRDANIPTYAVLGNHDYSLSQPGPGFAAPHRRVGYRQRLLALPHER